MEKCPGCGFEKAPEECRICQEIDIWYNRAVENTLQVCMDEIAGISISAENTHQYNRGIHDAMALVEARLKKLYTDFKQSTEGK